MNAASWRSRPRVAVAPAATLALAGCLATLVLFYPGILSPDSVAMYRQVASGSRYSVKPPLFIDVWRLTDQLVCGSGGIFALHVVLYWSGALAVALAVASSPLRRAGLVLVLGLLPPVAGRLPMVSTDGAVVIAWTLAVGLLLHRDVHQPALARRSRRALSAAAFVLLGYGALVRHNAIAGVLPLLWLWVTPAVAERASGAASRRRWVAAIALTLLIAVAAQALNRTAAPLRPWTQVLFWDLGAISLRSGEMLMPPYVLRDPGAADDLERLEEHFSSWSAIKLVYFGDRYTLYPLDGEQAGRLVRDWMAAVAGHPVHYARHRGLVLLRLLGFEGVPLTPLFLNDPPVSREMDRCRGAALPIRFEPSAATDAIRRGLFALAQTPLYRPWLWVAMAVAIVIAAGYFDRVRGRFARAIACSGLLYVAPLALVAPTIEFRYTLWLHAATAIALVLAAASLAELRRAKITDQRAGTR